MLTGYVLGPGLEVALACDFRVASDTAILGFPETKLGVLPSFGTMHRLPALLGASKSKKLLLTGKLVHAEEAEWLGLVDVVSPDPLTHARKIADSVARLPLSDTKRLLSGASLADERNAFANCCNEETKKRIEGAFKAKPKV